MPATSITTLMVPLGRIFLNHENPRHESVASEAAAIEKLCNKEDVLPLAGDIVKYGVNPLELVGLLQIDQKKTDQNNPIYIAMEGNRRVCALKLLNDPELAPPKLRKSFENLTQDWTAISQVPSVIFSTVAEAKLWMGRIHNGAQGGIGRKSWDAEQKSRHDGENKNRSAQSLLDYAEKIKALSPGERARKITTAQRFISNDVFRETLGIDNSDPDNLNRTRPKHDFDIILRRFIRDLVEGNSVTSRMNKEDIIRYARGLNSLAGLEGTRIEAESLTSGRIAPIQNRPARKTSPKIKKVEHIQFDDKIYQALRTLGNEKLLSLYYSICSVELDPHTPLVCVGAWSFFETFTACAGRHDGTSFDSFLSKSKLSTYGITTNIPALTSALGRMREYGNSTKHHHVAATFNGDQLNNDMVTLRDVILACIDDAIRRGT